MSAQTTVSAFAIAALAFATVVSATALGTAPALANNAAPVASGASGQRITVKCARYLSRGVIWDRALPVFLDDLTRVGYTLEEAQAIGSRVCRDEAGVGNTQVLGDTMRRILRETPPRGRH